MVTPPLLLADTESSVNERLPFTSLELEAHWNVDCSATLSTIIRDIESLDVRARQDYLKGKIADGQLKKLIDNEHLIKVIDKVFLIISNCAQQLSATKLLGSKTEARDYILRNGLD